MNYRVKEEAFVAYYQGKSPSELTGVASRLVNALFGADLKVDQPLEAKVIYSGKPTFSLRQGELTYFGKLIAFGNTLIHNEEYASFRAFLVDVGAPTSILTFFDDWMAYPLKSYSSGDVYEKLSRFKERTSAFNHEIQAKKELSKAIFDRLFFVGEDPRLGAADALYYGDAHSGCFCKRMQLSKYLEHCSSYVSGPHVGPLTFSPYTPKGKSPEEVRIVFRWKNLPGDLNFAGSRY